MTFLTILGVTEILCIFRLVLKGKTGKEIYSWVIKIRVVRKVFSKQFCFIRCRRQRLQAVAYSRYSGFTFAENTISNSPKVPRAKFLESNGLFCFISICKFGSFKNLFAMITSLSELYLRIRRFFSLVQTKKVISMNYGSNTSSWKPWRWMRLELILLMRDVYIKSNLNSMKKFTNSHRSTEFKDILPWNISQMKRWSQRLSQSAQE